VPNIRYRPNIRQHFLAEYSFSAETRKSVFGRSLPVIFSVKPVDFSSFSRDGIRTILWSREAKEILPSASSVARPSLIFQTECGKRKWIIFGDQRRSAVRALRRRRGKAFSPSLSQWDVYKISERLIPSTHL
jgi:hypothetical protein